MVRDVAGATFFFAGARDHLQDILVVENGSPIPMEPGKALSTTVVP